MKPIERATTPAHEFDSPSRFAMIGSTNGLPAIERTIRRAPCPRAWRGRRGGDVIVGTSAGAILGAQLAGGIAVLRLYATYLDTPRPAEASPPAPDLRPFVEMVLAEKAKRAPAPRWCGGSGRSSDSATEAAFASVAFNLLDPTVIPLAAQTGRAQGRRVASEYSEFW